MNQLMQPQTAMQGGQTAPIGAVSPQNMSMQSAQPNPMGMGGMVPPIPPSPQQIQDFHNHLSDRQRILDEILKKPDEDLNLKQVYRMASDLITHHRMSDGKRGASAAEIVSELSSPNFPREDAKGNPPTPQVIRQFLQNHFDEAVMKQAVLIGKFGKPVDYSQNGNTQSSINMNNNNLTPAQ